MNIAVPIRGKMILFHPGSALSFEIMIKKLSLFKNTENLQYG